MTAHAQIAEDPAVTSLSGLHRRLSAPSADEISAAITADLTRLRREFPETLRRGVVARAALMAARDAADFCDRKAITVLIDATTPHARCVLGEYTAAEELRYLADELRTVAALWDDEAERVIGAA